MFKANSCLTTAVYWNPGIATERDVCRFDRNDRHIPFFPMTYLWTLFLMPICLKVEIVQIVDFDIENEVRKQPQSHIGEVPESFHIF